MLRSSSSNDILTSYLSSPLSYLLTSEPLNNILNVLATSELLTPKSAALSRSTTICACGVPALLLVVTSLTLGSLDISAFISSANSLSFSLSSLTILKETSLDPLPTDDAADTTTSVPGTAFKSVLRVSANSLELYSRSFLSTNSTLIDVLLLVTVE